MSTYSLSRLAALASLTPPTATTPPRTTRPGLTGTMSHPSHTTSRHSQARGSKDSLILLTTFINLQYLFPKYKVVFM